MDLPDVPQTIEEAEAFVAQWKLKNALGPWPMTERQRSFYEKEFEVYDEYNDGYICKDVFIKAFSTSRRYGLGVSELQQIWSLADQKAQNQLDRSEFATAMHLLENISAGCPMPTELPHELILVSKPTLDLGVRDYRGDFNKLAPTGESLVMSLNQNLLAKVADEIWVSILAHLPKSSLLKTSRTSKRLRTLSIPLLYNEVDMSLHDHEPYKLNFADNGTSQPWTTYGPSEDDIQRTLKKQCRLILQLLRRREYGAYVRSFRWTMGLEIHHRLLPRWLEGGSFQWDSDQVYKVFSLLDQTLSVDIGGGTIHNYPPLLVGSLFPRARNIRLRGNLHYKLAWDILSGENKAALTSLSLHDLQAGGMFSPGEDFPLEMNNHADPSCLIPRWENTGRPKGYQSGREEDLTGPANMRRLLTIPSLQKRCQNIQYLFLSKQG